MNDKRDRMLTVQEVADILHVHPNTVRHWSEQGLLKAHRVGPRGDRRFRAEDIDSFLNMCKPNGKSEVLIVDDDPAILQLLKEAVEGHGCNATCCENAERALHELESRHFHLIFLDLVLPGMSGVDVLRAIKGKSDKTVVAVLTGYGDAPVALQAMALGPMFFIRKPFGMAGIIEVIDTVVGAQR